MFSALLELNWLNLFVELSVCFCVLWMGVYLIHTNVFVTQVHYVGTLLATGETTRFMHRFLANK